MNYKIVRIDGKEDDVTSQTFSNFADAYDLLDKIYGDICCSDADYGDIIYYDIVEDKKIEKNINENHINKDMKNILVIITNIC